VAKHVVGVPVLKLLYASSQLRIGSATYSYQQEADQKVRIFMSSNNQNSHDSATR